MYEYRIYDKTNRPCPKCGGKFETVMDKDLFRCDNCGTYIDAFVLTPVQLAAKEIKMSGKYSVVFEIGGKAGGKTFGNAVTVRDIAQSLTGEFEFAVGAITLKQNKVAYKELLRKMPDEWISLTDKGKLDIKQPSQAGEGHIQLKNGILIRFIPTKNLGSIKSESFFLIWMLEITEGVPEFYNELLFRSRGDMRLGIKADVKGIMLFETNSPDPNKPEQFFVEDMFWHKSTRVYWSQEKFVPADRDEVNPEYVTIVYDSFDNVENLSDSFISRAFKHKDKGEVDLQSKGFLIQAGHKIYPTAGEHVKEDEGYAGQMPWFASVDQGISDQLVINFFFINPYTYQIMQFTEKVAKEMNLITAANAYHEKVAVYGLEQQYEIHDPIGCKKMFQRESDARTIADKWEENGISLVSSPINAVLPKIGRVQKLFEDDMFFMYSNCKESIRQHISYKGVRDKRTNTIKPQEKDDHTCEATRNAMSWLPIELEKQDKKDRYKKYRKYVDSFMERAKYYQGSRVVQAGYRNRRSTNSILRKTSKRGLRRL